jgi:hypothetical protein
MHYSTHHLLEQDADAALITELHVETSSALGFFVSTFAQDDPFPTR